MKRLIIAFSLLITFLCISQDSQAQTQRSRTYLHGRFETGDKPTQTDYRDVFATFFSRLEDSLSISVLYGVDTISNDVTLADSSTVALVTEAAVKGYVDAAAGSVTNGDKGDITVSSGAWTIDNDAVDAAAIATGAVGTDEIATNSVVNADLATMATNTLKGNDAVGTATPQDLTTTEVKTMLAIQTTDLSDFEEATEDLIGVNIVAGSGVTVVYDDGTGNTTISSSSLADGDKGDITVSSSGTSWNIDASAVTTTEILDNTVTTSDLSWQSVVDEMRDSTIFSANAYTDIPNISTTLKSGDRIKVKDTGAEYLVQNDSLSGYITDGIGVISTGSKYAVLQPNTGNIIPEYFGIANDGTHIDSTLFARYLSFCEHSGNTPYFTAGTYSIPTGFGYNWGESLMKIDGAGKDKVKITNYITATDADWKGVPERINTVNQPPSILPDGVYTVDIAAQDSSILHREYWSHYANMVVDTNFLVENGLIVRFFGQDSVVARGYVAELNTNEAPPTEEGYYIVSSVSCSWGGGYAYCSLKSDGHAGWSSETFGASTYDTLVIMGTLLRLSGGTWTRVRPGNGFCFRGDLQMQNIGFLNIAMYATLPSGGSGLSEKKYIVENVSAKDLLRFSALETASGLYFQDTLGVIRHDVDATSATDTLYTFDEIVFQNCDFEQVGQFIDNNFPAHRSKKVINNRIKNSFTFLSFFISITEANLSPRESQYLNNTFLDCRNYTNRSGTGDGLDNLVFIRTWGNSVVSDNSFKRVNSNPLYISQANNIIRNNDIWYTDIWNPGQASYVFDVKIDTRTSETINTNFFHGNTLKIVQGNPTIFRQRNTSNSSLSGEQYLGTAFFPVTVNTPSDSLRLTKDNTYTVLDSTMFVDHAEGKVSSTLLSELSTLGTSGIRVYYDFFTKEWKSISGVTYSPLFTFDMYDPAEHVSLKVFDCDLEGEQLIGYGCGSDPTINKFEIDNSRIYLSGNLASASCATTKEFVIRNSFVNLLGSGQSQYFTAERFINIDNVTFEKGARGLLKMSAPKIEGYNIRVKKRPYLSRHDYGLTSNSDVNGILINGTQKAVINGLTVDNETYRTNALKIEGFDSIRVKNMYADLYSDIGTTENYIGIEIDTTDRDFVIISDVQARIRDVDSNRESTLVKFKSTKATTVSQLDVHNVYPLGAQADSLNYLLRGDSLTVTSLRLSDNINYNANEYDLFSVTNRLLNESANTYAVNPEGGTNTVQESLNSISTAGTLAGISAKSDDTAKSLYQLTSGVSAEFRTASGSPLLFLRESTGKIGIGKNNPNRELDVVGIIEASSNIISGANITLGSSSNIQWSTRSRMTSSADGTIRLTNAAQTAFTSLQFGGGTSSFPMLKVSGTNLIARLADDSANSDFEVLDEAYNATSWNGNNEVPTKNAIRDQIEGLDGTYWKLGGQTLGATGSIGPIDQQTFNLSTNGSARLSLDGLGKFTSGTLTDIQLTASDSVTLNASGSAFSMNGAYTRFYDGSNIVMQVNNSTGAFAWNVADNNSNAFVASVTGGGDSFLQHNSTDGAEVTTIGSGASGSTIQAAAPLILKNYTATEASALTPAAGMLVYVTDTNGTFTSVGFWGYENGAWTKL